MGRILWGFVGLGCLWVLVAGCCGCFAVGLGLNVLLCFDCMRLV